MIGKINWHFEDYYYQLMYVEEILHLPGMTKYRDDLLNEMWEFFPQECTKYLMPKE
jgi:hypothetical protein